MYNEFFNSDEINSSDVVFRFENMLLSEHMGYFDVEEFENLTDHYLNNLKIKKSLMVVEEGLKQHPGSSSLLLCKARVLFKMGKYKTALHIVEKLSYRSFDEEVLMLEGEILLRLERFQAANDIFNSIIEDMLEDKDKMCLDIAFIYMGIQQIKTALYYLKKGLKINPNNVEILFELALYAEENEKYDQAVVYYNTLLDINPYSEEAWFNLGMTYSAMEKFEKAIEAFDYSMVIDPGFYNAIFQKGVALLRLNQYQKALDSFKAFINTDANNDEVLLYLAECYEGIGDYVMAESFYYKILDSTPEVYDAWIGLGFCKQSSRDYLESINCFKRAIDIDDTDEEAWTGMGESYFYAGFKNDASKAFVRSLKIDPIQEDVWQLLIALRIENEEIDEARSALLLAKSVLVEHDGFSELEQLIDIMTVDSQQDETAGDSSNVEFIGKDSSMLILSKIFERKHSEN